MMRDKWSQPFPLTQKLPLPTQIRAATHHTHPQRHYDQHKPNGSNTPSRHHPQAQTHKQIKNKWMHKHTQASGSEAVTHRGGQTRITTTNKVVIETHTNKQEQTDALITDQYM